MYKCIYILIHVLIWLHPMGLKMSCPHCHIFIIYEFSILPFFLTYIAKLVSLLFFISNLLRCVQKKQLNVSVILNIEIFFVANLWSSFVGVKCVLEKILICVLD